MSTWKRKAIEATPQIRQKLENAPSPMLAWIELRPVFEAYVRAGNRAGVDRVMRFARYCISAPDADVRMAVAVAFIEHLPESDAFRAILPELLSPHEIRALGPILAYHAGDAAVAEIEATARRMRAGLSPVHKPKR